MYLALAVEITSLLRRQLPAKVWRRTHMLSVPVLLLATVHFTVAGTDADQPYAFVGIAVAALVIAGLVGRRLLGVLTSSPTSARIPVAATREPHPAVVSSHPPTVPNRGESRWAPTAVHEEPPSPQPSPR